MSPKERLHRQLTTAREVSEQLLADFTKPDDWVYRAHDRANHALWFVGHMAQVDDFLIGLMAPEKKGDRPGYAERFGMGSQPSPQLADYPPVEEVLEYMRDRRAVVLEVLSGMTEEQLALPLPEGVPGFMTDYASAFEMAVWHEGIHTGQLTVARRGLGHEPIFSAPPSDG